MATGRAGSVKGASSAKQEPYLNFWFSTPFGVIRPESTVELKGYDGKKFAISNNNAPGMQPVIAWQVAYCPPDACGKFMLPGWSQADILVASKLYSLPLRKMSEVTKDFVLDRQMVEDVAVQCAILFALHFVKPGAPVVIPAVSYSAAGYNGKNSPSPHEKAEELNAMIGMVETPAMSYDQALAKVGLDQFAYINLSDVNPSSPLEAHGLDKWISIDDSAFSSKKIWRIKPADMQAGWPILSKLGWTSEDSYKDPEGYLLPAPPTLFTLVVKATNLNLREGPSTGSKSKGKLESGEVLYQIKNPSEGWVYVCSSKLGYGYVSDDAKYIEAVSPEGDAVMDYSVSSYTSGSSSGSASGAGSESQSEDLPKGDSYVEEEEESKKDSMLVPVIAGGIALAAAAAVAVVMFRKKKQD